MQREEHAVLQNSASWWQRCFLALFGVLGAVFGVSRSTWGSKQILCLSGFKSGRNMQHIEVCLILFHGVIPKDASLILFRGFIPKRLVV